MLGIQVQRLAVGMYGTLWKHISSRGYTELLVSFLPESFHVKRSTQVGSACIHNVFKSIHSVLALIFLEIISIHSLKESKDTL